VWGMTLALPELGSEPSEVRASCGPVRATDVRFAAVRCGTFHSRAREARKGGKALTKSDLLNERRRSRT
jgi:hypothetical protein